MSINDVALTYLQLARVENNRFIELLTETKQSSSPSRYLNLISASVAYLNYVSLVQLTKNLFNATSPQRQAIIDELALYGVGLMDSSDIQAYPNELAGLSVSQFTDSQLATILDGVRITGLKFALSASLYFKQVVLPPEAFNKVYGILKFGYVPSRTTGLTIATGIKIPNQPDDYTAPMNRNNPIFILLGEKSFPTSTTILPPLHPSFVPTHELGHAFHNRHGGKTETVSGHAYAPIVATQYVQATGACWELVTRYVTESSYCRRRLPEYKNTQRQNLDVNGNPTTNPNQFAYVIHGGLYIPEPYEIDPIGLFPNESRRDGPNPSEGFADTFANVVLNINKLPETSKRRIYFETNWSNWIDDIIIRL
jgi:hypothetical protein